MKCIIKTLKPCLAVVLFGVCGTSHATIVTVDSNMTNGAMAVFLLNASGGPDYGAFQFGGTWGLSDVKSTVSGSNILLEANYNTYADNPGSAYWRDNNGAGPGGNKWMVASTSTKVSASWFSDGNCNFRAEVTDYTFVEGYSVRAFIKGVSGTNSFTLLSDPLEEGSVVNLDFLTSSWAEIEYGFEVQGINANPAFPPGSATVVATTDPPVEPLVGIPNAGFETPDGAKWAFDQANGHTISYPTEGGNPGGYAELDALSATQPFFGVLVSNGRLPIPLSALGLSPGQKVTFAMDMKIITGDNIGGFKIDFVPSGTTNDMRPTKRGDGTDWSTYSFAATIPANATGLKLVPLWGLESTVAYDNIRLVETFSASASTNGPNVEISWPTVSGRTYRVMKSGDLSDWAPFGAVADGNGSTFTVMDPVASPGKSFYQVLETSP